MIAGVVLGAECQKNIIVGNQVAIPHVRQQFMVGVHRIIAAGRAMLLLFSIPNGLRFRADSILTSSGRQPLHDRILNWIAVIRTGCSFDDCVPW